MHIAGGLGASFAISVLILYVSITFRIQEPKDAIEEINCPLIILVLSTFTENEGVSGRQEPDNEAPSQTRPSSEDPGRK